MAASSRCLQDPLHGWEIVSSWKLVLYALLSTRGQGYSLFRNGSTLDERKEHRIG